MGFFALRKVDPSSIPLSHSEVSPSGHSDRSSVAQIIRARFNGRKRRQTNLSKSSLATDIPSINSSNHPSSRTSPYYNLSDNDIERRSSQQPGTRRTSSDVATVTLAHKLNELAAAHKEGLLNDDDYRVLRQNLFNSFATHSAPPVETPVVKSVEPVVLQLPSGSRSDCLTVNSSRAPSLLTQTTNRSSVSTLFHRLRRRASHDRGTDEQDRISIFSSGSRMPISPALNSNPRELGRQPSSASLKTTRSQHIPPDLRSVSSKRSIRSTATASDIGGMSRGSTRSLRGNEPPPSSFNPKHLSSRLLPLDGNVDRLRSAADIRAAIRAVEAEQQTVVASLSLHSRHHLESFDAASNYSRSMTSRTLSQQHISMSGKDLVSNRSLADPSSIVFPNSDERWLVSQGLSVPDMDNHLVTMSEDAQLYELERRRAEINMRYQQRLDYLRARLKGAEIHERLLRK